MGNGNSISVMDIVLAVIGVFLAVFTLMMVWIYYKTGSIPEVLVTAVFTACTGELGFMGWIKNTKEKYREREWQKEDAASKTDDKKEA